MKLVPISVEHLAGVMPENSLLCFIGRIAGECYGSAIDENKCINRALNCIARGHHSPWEHYNVTIKCTVDRGTSHALVRHRHCAFQQSSTIYQKYDELSSELNELNNKIDELNMDMPIKTPEQIEVEVNKVEDEIKEVENINNTNENNELEEKVIDIKELETEYEEVKKEIIGYLETNKAKLNGLKLHKERLIEEKNTIDINDPSRNSLIAEYDKQINETEKGIKAIISPSKEVDFPLSTPGILIVSL